MMKGIVTRTDGRTTTWLRTWALPGNVGAAEHNLPMTTAEGTAGAAALLAFLDAQRECVLAIVDGLDEDLLMTPALPSGWTPLGLIEHLGHAERHWFQEVALGSAAPRAWPEDHPGNEEDEDAPYTTSRPPEVVFAFYRDQIGRANAVVATTPRSARPVGRHNREGTERSADHHAAHDRGDGPARGAPGRRPRAARRADRPGPPVVPAQAVSAAAGCPSPSWTSP
jgi:Protein of unknown function (DUF664)